MGRSHGSDWPGYLPEISGSVAYYRIYSGRNDAGDEVEGENALGALRIAVDVEGDAHLEEEAFGGVLLAEQLAIGEGLDGVERHLDMRARATVGGKHLIVEALSFVAGERSAGESAAARILLTCIGQLVHYSCVMRKPFGFRLDEQSGVPVYRQIIDQVLGGIAAGSLAPGNQLPTVRQVAVDLSINPNTVMRAYREMEIRGVLETQQGTGTFISQQKIKRDDLERQRQLSQLVTDFISRAGAAGFTIEELMEQIHERQYNTEKNRR